MMMIVVVVVVVLQLVRRLAEASPDNMSSIKYELNAGLANQLRGDMESLLEQGNRETFQSYRFTDIQTPFGTLKATVVYRAQCDFEVSGSASP